MAGVGVTNTIREQLHQVGIVGAEQDEFATSMSGYVMQSRADNTVKKYSTAFLQFSAFCDNKGLVSKPAKPICVAMYLTSLLNEGKSVSVILGAVYAIKWAHRVNDLIDPTDNSIVISLMDAAKRTHSKPTNKKDTVSSDMIKELCSDFESTTDIIELRDLTMIVIFFAGFLRFSEIQALRCNDIQVKSDHLVIKIRKSKTDQLRKGDEVLISKGVSSACPHSLLNRYISQANIDLESDNFLFKPAFRSKGKASLIKKNKPLSYTRTNEIVVKKLRTVAPGLKLATHTLRASGASTVVNNSDISERCLKRHGRWKTEQAKDGYIEDSLERRLSVSKALNL